MDTITIYAVFLDMEHDVPDAYVLDEKIAQLLKRDVSSADYITLQVSEKKYMELFNCGVAIEVER